MKAKQTSVAAADLFRSKLSSILNPEHRLLQLSLLLDWNLFPQGMGWPFPVTTGQPATDPHLVTGLMYLQHTYQLSDKSVVDTWLENPYWQSFCGMKSSQYCR